MNLIERREVVPRIPKLSEVYHSATFAPNRSLDPSIGQIDLGSLSYEAQILRDKTANDPKHREAGKFVLIRNDIFPRKGHFKVIVEKEPRMGEVSTIEFQSEIRHISDIKMHRFLSKDERQGEFVEASVHTHPLGGPPSSADMADLFLDDSQELSASTSVFVVTDKFNYLVFRGPETPMLNQDEVSKLIKEWDEKKQKKLELVKSKNINKTDRERLDSENAVKREIFNEVIYEYGFLVFTGRADSRTVSRVNALLE